MNIDKYLNYLDESLPEILNSNDIVSLGLFDSSTFLHTWEKDTNNSLPFIKMSNCYLYKKEDVLNWIRNFYRSEYASARVD